VTEIHLQIAGQDIFNLSAIPLQCSSLLQNSYSMEIPWNNARLYGKKIKIEEGKFFG